ncbi:MAG: glycerophosphodiester phosphodiesterase [Streptococcus sp.]|nr:MAG: glycerophosphodiester phosphodiesterase [Streptococcus sp.]
MKPEKLSFKRFYHNLDKILVLFFMVFMMMEYAWIPFNSYAAEYLLKQTGYLFLSYNNVWAVLSSNWLVGLGFLVLVVVNLFVAYFQSGMIFMGIRNLLDKENRPVFAFLGKTFRDSFAIVKKAGPGKMLFIVLYMGFLFPFLRQILKIYYLNKILVPDFIVTYLANNIVFAVFMGLLVVGMLLVAVRLMFALPQLFFEHATVPQAIRFSLAKTKNRLFFYTRHLFWIIIKSFLLYTFLSAPAILGQRYANTQPNEVVLFSGIVAFVLIKFAYYAMLSYFLLKFVSFLTDRTLNDYPTKRGLSLMRWFVLTIASLSFALEGYVYLNFPLENVPITISHRGVSRENGIQNTVEALEKTALLKPDLVEMDVQETKDGQFVMMHDANLKQLAGLDAQPQDLTLAELTSLEISENGYRAKISSFDDYFTRANQLGQRLLIEIKTSKKDSKDMMERFLSKYGAKIKVYQHQIQSLDYQVIDQVVKYDSSIPSFFILPYNTIFPRTKASGYTMEYSTLDENFVNKLWQSDKRLYDWTINDEDSIVKSFRLGVDGMITDDLELVQTSIKELKDDPDYTTLLLNKSIDLLSFS